MSAYKVADFSNNKDGKLIQVHLCLGLYKKEAVGRMSRIEGNSWTEVKELLSRMVSDLCDVYRKECEKDIDVVNIQRY